MLETIPVDVHKNISKSLTIDVDDGENYFLKFYSEKALSCRVITREIIVYDSTKVADNDYVYTARLVVQY